MTGSGVGSAYLDYILDIKKTHTPPVGAGSFDAVALRRSAQINSVSGLCITKLDVLGGLGTIWICLGYRYRGGTSDVTRWEEAIYRLSSSTLEDQSFDIGHRQGVTGEFLFG